MPPVVRARHGRVQTRKSGVQLGQSERSRQGVKDRQSGVGGGGEGRRGAIRWEVCPFRRKTEERGAPVRLAIADMCISQLEESPEGAGIATG